MCDASLSVSLKALGKLVEILHRNFADVLPQFASNSDSEKPHFLLMEISEVYKAD